MANHEAVANARADNWEIFLGADNSPLWGALSLPLRPGMTPITSGRYGESVLGFLETNPTFQFEITWRQSAPDDIKRIMGVSGAGPHSFPASIGAQPTPQVIRFHDPAAGENTDGDLYILAAVSLGPAINSDGAGMKEWVQQFHATLDLTTGKVWRLGAAA